MAASSRGGRVLRGALLTSSANASVCSRCATGYTRVPTRLFSASVVDGPNTSTSAASSSSSSPPPSAAVSSSSSTTAADAAAAYDIRSGMILTRPPLVTRKLTSFENAFFFYQKRLEERLNTPFVTSVYFKPDTARRIEWDLKVKERQGTVAKELGNYHGKSAWAWNDEIKVDDTLSSQESLVGSLLKDAQLRVSDDAELIPEEDIVPIEPPPSRVTEADEKGDVRRLDRKLDRTLYLVVKGKDGWAFPADVIPEGENLHQCAQRVLEQAAGVNMNTWLVGRVPVAHVVTQPVQGNGGAVEQKGQKTFFIKGRIMAGQADLKGNPFGYTDFMWLTQEELKKEFAPSYYKGVRNMMANR